MIEPAPSGGGFDTDGPVAQPVIKTPPASIPQDQSGNIVPVEDGPKASSAYVDQLQKLYGISIEGGLTSEGGLWSTEQLVYLTRVLGTLPKSFVASTDSFKRVANFMGQKSVLGYVFAGIPKYISVTG